MVNYDYISYASVLDDVFSMINDIKSKQEIRKDEIAAEWEYSKQLPRKQKKKLRKRLELEWQIANFDIA